MEQVHVLTYSPVQSCIECGLPWYKKMAAAVSSVDSSVVMDSHYHLLGEEDFCPFPQSKGYIPATRLFDSVEALETTQN